MDFTIDIAGAVQKLVEKQQLNHVHYAVQLIRACLDFEPSNIQIQTDQGSFSIQHDGANLDPDFWQALVEVLTLGNEPPAFLALKRIEHNYGLTLLFPFRHSDQVLLHSGTRTIERSGTQTRTGSASHLAGFRLQMARPKAQEGDERAEISFFCRRPPCNLHLNGRPLTPKEALSQVPALLRGHIQNEHGEAFFGLDVQASLSEIHYLKHGILFGTRTFLNSHSLPLILEWDSKLQDKGTQFEKSIAAGDEACMQAQLAIQEALVSHFLELDPALQDQLRRKILALQTQPFPQPLAAIRLFRTNISSIHKSLADLRKDQKRFGGWLPFHFMKPKPSREALAILGPQELAFLRAQDLKPVRWQPVMDKKGMDMTNWLTDSR